MSIEGFVHESVRTVIVLPWDKCEDDIGQCFCDCPDLFDKNLERRHADAVFPVQLLHNQLGIQITDEAVGMIQTREIESLDQGAVLGDIVRRDADDFGVLLEDRPAERVLDDAANGCLSGISAGSPVGEEVECTADGDGLFFLATGRCLESMFHCFRRKAPAFANEMQLFRELASQWCGEADHWRGLYRYVIVPP